jgi:hypothetical protein
MFCCFFFPKIFKYFCFVCFNFVYYCKIIISKNITFFILFFHLMCPLWRGESNGKLLNFKRQGEPSRRTPKDLYIQTIIGETTYCTMLLQRALCRATSRTNTCIESGMKKCSADNWCPLWRGAIMTARTPVSA